MAASLPGRLGMRLADRQNPHSGGYSGARALQRDRCAAPNRPPISRRTPTRQAAPARAPSTVGRGQAPRGPGTGPRPAAAAGTRPASGAGGLGETGGAGGLARPADRPGRRRATMGRHFRAIRHGPSGTRHTGTRKTTQLVPDPWRRAVCCGRCSRHQQARQQHCRRQHRRDPGRHPHLLRRARTGALRLRPRRQEFGGRLGPGRQKRVRLRLRPFRRIFRCVWFNSTTIGIDASNNPPRNAVDSPAGLLSPRYLAISSRLQVPGA